MSNKIRVSKSKPWRGGYISDNFISRRIFGCSGKKNFKPCL